MIRVVGKSCKISDAERVIGVVGDNETENKVFGISRYYQGIDLGAYAGNIEVKPINSSLLPYTKILNKVVKDDEIFLTWKVDKYDTQERGKLYFNIWLGDENGKIWQTCMDYFSVCKSVNGFISSSEQPPSIWEEAVVRATDAANRAEEQANKAEEIAQNIKNEGSNLQYDSFELFPIAGVPGFTYIDRSNSFLYYWDSSISQYIPSGPYYNDIQIINGGNASGERNTNK